ncbi:transcript variant X2 [Nothobranchius furzeri]|uniref:Transcript variant X1 n=1 Tax=Nothobranchius furzeri TaxID=105023 RepID=A0A9D2Z000_NOTFU|nr:transcript variant X1 [Nothobranchius furzeri]KAF7229783.1 transcript variant X2 [Nothobranchius furzeri]
MSNRWTNPYAPGHPNHPQNPYGPSGPMSLGGPGSSPSSLGASSIPNNPGSFPQFLNLPVTYRPEQRMVPSEMKTNESINLYVTRAREEAIHQSHGSPFINTQREEILPFTSTKEQSYPGTSGPKTSDVDSSSSVLNWLQICKAPMEDKPSSSKSSAQSDFPGTSDGRRFTSTERQHGSQTVRSLSSHVSPPSEAHHTWYSQELAAGILQRFGLEKDDLQILLSYPEDQINSDNLPHILKQILLQKQNRAAPRPDLQPGPSFIEQDRSKMSGNSLSSMPSNTKVSKVIEYRHTGKYSSAGTDPGKTSKVTSGGSMLQFDAPGSSSYKEPLQQSSSKMTTSGVVTSQSQMESPVSFSWIKNVVPPVSDPTKQLQTQLSQTSKSTFASAPPPKKDTDSKPLNVELSKIVTSQDLKQGCQQSKPFGGQFKEDKHARGDDCDPFEDAKQPEKEELINQENKQITQSNQEVKPMQQLAQLQQQFQQQQLKMQTQLQQKFQQQQLMWQAQLQQKLQLQTVKQAQAQLQQQTLQRGQSLLPQRFPGMPPVSSLSSIQRPIGVSSPLLQPNQNAFQYPNYVLSPGSQQFSGTVCMGIPPLVSKGIPPLVNINDYAATTPTMFPHVCSLCLTKCDTLMDWLAHQNIPLHLENCKSLRRRYPQWDGEQTPVSTQANKRARSRSPRHHHGSKHLRESSRSSSRSRSHSPQHRRSRRRSSRRSRSRSRHRGSESKRRRRSSRSHERSSSRSKDKKRSRRSRDRRSPSDGSTPKRARSASTERLARKLVQSSGVRSLSHHFDLDAIVKTLTPGLLAELTKASAVRSDEEENEDDVPSSNQVILELVSNALSHKDVVNAVEQFGKTESVVLYRSRQQAIVRYTNEEDAEKLRSVKKFDLKGQTIKVTPEKSVRSATSKEQKKPQQTSCESSVSAPPDSEAILSSTTGEANISSPKAETSAEEHKGPTDGPPPACAEAETGPGAAEKPPTAAGDSALVKGAEKQGEEQSQEAEGSKVKPAAAKTSLIKLRLIRPPTHPGESTLETPDPQQSPHAADKTPVSSSEAPCQLQSEQETPEPTAGDASYDSGAAEEKSKSVGQVSAESTQEASAPSTKPNVPATGKKWNSAYDYSLDPETSRTVGDVVDTFLNDQCLRCFKNQQRCLDEDFNAQLLLINNLPEYKDGCYTEEEVAALLVPFGFKYEVDTIYVIPQTRFALALMPTVKDLQKVVKETWDGVAFKGCELCLRPVNNKILLSPVGFYKSLMKLMKFDVTDDGSKTVLFYDISQSEIKELREVLIKNFSVRNFLPLLNKLYVEFASNHDVDLLGLSYSKHREGRTHKLFRLKSPNLPNRTAAKANIPPGCNPPFWLTMKTAPYLFPTATPWFYIPNYITVSKVKSIPETDCQNFASFAVMLTGLPEDNYTVDDIAKLAWQYLPLKNFQTLYTDLIVLPLQRRAFLFFSDWSSGLNFIQDHIKKPFVIDGCPLGVFLVLQLPHPGLREEEVYKNVLKWSNHHVEDPDTLEERMLHVQTLEASLSVVDSVMSVVSSVATFVNFLPLGNRIYIEMPDSSAAVRLLEKIKSLDNLHADGRWCVGVCVCVLRKLQLHILKSSSVVMRPRNLTKNARTKHRKGNEPAFMPRLVKPTASAEFTSFQSKLGPSDTSLEKSAVFRRVTRSSALQKSSDIPEFHRTEGEPMEGTSDHTMSTESNAAPPVESESKMETSALDPEMVEETADKNQTLSDQSSGNDEKHCDHIPNENNHMGGEENDKNSSKHLTEEVSETSVANQTITEPECQKLEAPDDAGPTEDDEVNQVMDSREDQPTTETVTELEGTNEGSLASRLRSRTSNEDKEMSSKKQGKMIRKYETRVKNQTEKEEKVTEGTKEVKDCAEEASTSHGSGRIKMVGGVKENQKTLDQMKKPEQVHAKKTLDDSGAGEPMNTRSTRGRERAKKDAEHEKTQTKRQHTPPKKSNTVREEEEVTYVILDAVEVEDVEEGPPTTPKPRTERSKIKIQTVKEELPNTTADVEDVWQILDSVDDEEPPAEPSAAPEGDNRRTTERAASPADTQNDRTLDEPMRKDVFIEKKMTTSETECELITEEASGSSDVDRPTQDTTKEESLSVGGLPAAEDLVTGDTQTTPGMELNYRNKPEREPRTEAPGEKIEEPEMGSDVGGPPGEAEEMAASAKRRHDDVTEGCVTLATSDEVGKAEEETKVTRSRTRGRPRKKARKTPVRKSTRRETPSAEDEREEEEKDKSPPAPMVFSSTLDQDPPAPSGDLEAQTMEVSAEQQRRSESPVGQKLSACVEEEEEKKLISVDGENVRDLVGPETKPSPDDFQLPPFDPDRPLGMEFTVRRWAHFCNLCSVFYTSENSEKDPHCCSETHYNNLKKHYQELQQKPAGASEGPRSSTPTVSP